MKLIHSCLCSCLLLLASFADAQYVTDYKRTADMHFARGNYYSASQYYEKYLNSKQGKNVESRYKPYTVAMKTEKQDKDAITYESVVYRLAESYRLFHDYTGAEKWYAKTISFNAQQYPLAALWYGVSLRANKKYMEAEQQFSDFLSRHSVKDEYRNQAEKELDGVRFIQQQLNAPVSGVSTQIMGVPVNQGGANYAAVWLENEGLVFTSTRPDSLQKHVSGDPYMNTLYLYAHDQVKKLPLTEATATHQGVASFSADGQRMYFTRWQLKNAKNMAEIFMSNRSGDKWSDPRKLSTGVNMEGYSSKQPFLAGDYLFFSSDRPGGAGKYDLWYTTVDKDGNTGDAVNLGLTINTPEDEEAPYYHTASQLLIFATKGRTGMGGFDLFQSRGALASWTEPVNLGYPINSVKDDIYFFSSSTLNPLAKAYISSDRNSVCCLDVFEIKKLLLNLSGKVMDCRNNEPINGATISLVDTQYNKVLFTGKTNAAGVYTFELEQAGPYKVIAEWQGYETRSKPVLFRRLSNRDTIDIETICLEKNKPYPVNQPVILKDIYYDFDKATLRPESFPVLDKLAAVMKEYPAMQIELGAHTDSKGTDDYNHVLSEERAKSCVNYLIQMGIEPSRLISKGFGECCPVAPNEINGKDNPDGRALNRRTEIRIIHY
ncbi:OmpA family protein [Sediminibacterium ginsengisoli]|uniref:WD40-like Beta Propeller Repeat n=1 Tax=Sediminibacterium ginsengisoli TaxID=413434 RepID=A0A1T4RAX2_9BACT|nr:OmpA family protein [Sediminibacterium ginsengisoli]SKA13190.1 WD40-like Beta Propeller Repeat [Sediminibacterium ginsengisoli]